MVRLKQIPESLLAKLWQERASRQRSLRSGDGRRFRVIYPGRVGNTAGPDFRDAVLLEEGSGLVRGDVEIHVNQRDWFAHGHRDDPRYNGVVLHTVACADAASTILQSGRQVAVIPLDALIDRAPSSAGEAGLWPLQKPHGYVPPESASELGDLLDDAGDERFLGKSGTFRVFLNEESPELVLYSALMEALGYSQNREPFLELATRVPIRFLRKAVLGLQARERVGVIQAVLLTTSGFLPARRADPGHRGWQARSLYQRRSDGGSRPGGGSQSRAEGPGRYNDAEAMASVPNPASESSHAKDHWFRTFVGPLLAFSGRSTFTPSALGSKGPGGGSDRLSVGTSEFFGTVAEPLEPVGGRLDGYEGRFIAGRRG